MGESAKTEERAKTPLLTPSHALPRPTTLLCQSTKRSEMATLQADAPAGKDDFVANTSLTVRACAER